MFPLTVRPRSPVPRVASPRVRDVAFTIVTTLAPVTDTARATVESMVLPALFRLTNPPAEATARVPPPVVVRAPVWETFPLAAIRVVWVRVPKFRVEVPSTRSLTSNTEATTGLVIDRSRLKSLSGLSARMTLPVRRVWPLMARRPARRMSCPGALRVMPPPAEESRAEPGWRR